MRPYKAVRKSPNSDKWHALIYIRGRWYETRNNDDSIVEYNSSGEALKCAKIELDLIDAE